MGAAAAGAAAGSVAGAAAARSVAGAAGAGATAEVVVTGAGASTVPLPDAAVVSIEETCVVVVEAALAFAEAGTALVPAR